MFGPQLKDFKMSFNKNNRTPLVEIQTRFKSAYSPKNQIKLEFPIQSPYTRQEYKQECDINHIMAQYEHTGLLPHINEAAPQYMDCTGQDFRQHMDYIAGAFSLFEELPSRIRDKFGNDPAEFLDFCSHDKNRPELAEMGLLSPDAMQRMAPPQGSPETPQKPAHTASEPDTAPPVS
ncbi:internal scaffolding protein [Blackfly microvirus SF02]|uniref:Internal scaffolding protein n=1 Tax=Blackfly microvirus SF02 TaxID=2576452 RepID=A0A4P8PSX3_9VIRU|nr:internal scaffolding protein [Blackfly microvirus SF02]